MTRCTVSGKPATNDEGASVPRDEKRADGQHVDHWVLCPSERAKGFVRPVRRTYVHLKCGCETSMPHAIAETYARDPHYYGSTFCCRCGGYFLVGAGGEFVWKDAPDEKVGT